MINLAKMLFVFFFHLLFDIIMQLHKSNFFSLIILTNQKERKTPPPPPPKKCRNFWLYWNIILNSSATSDFVNRQFYDLGSHTQVRINIFQILNLCKGNHWACTPPPQLRAVFFNINYLFISYISVFLPVLL